MADTCRKIDADLRESAVRLVPETGKPVRGRHRVRHRRRQLYLASVLDVACERLPIRQSMGQPGSPH